MKTAQKEELDKNQEIFAQRLEWFIRNYAPRDKYEEREFTTDLYILLDQARAIAQAPMISQMSAAMALVPFPASIILKK